MTKYDVVVVGAGPAGATAAKFLSEKGVKVLLLDKSRFPRDKPCGGVLSIRTLKRFPYVSGDLLSSYSFGGRIYSSSLKHSIEVHQESAVSAFVVRKDFDHGLVQLAVKNGTSFRDGVSVTDVQILKEKATVRLDAGESVESELVIGADGVWSTVARTAGLGHHYPLVGRCLFEEIPLAHQQLDEYFKEKREFLMYLKFQGVDGFGWVAPKKDCVNIGIGEIQPTGPRQRTKRPLQEIYHDFLHFLEESGLIPPMSSQGKTQGGFLPLQPLKKTYADRVLLCGDAAGQMNPLTGDGIHYAMSSGMFAANVCVMALEAGRTDAAFLSKYQTMWKQDFGAEIRLFSLVLKQLLKKDRDERYIRLLSKDPRFVELLVSKLNNLERMQDFQWMVARRFVLLYLRDLLGL
jgi:geranylgeranyl reductase family protein